MDNFSIGESVYIFSEKLEEVIRGTIEGFSEDRTRVKVLQETPGGLIRHIISWVYIFRDSLSAESVAQEYRLLRDSHREYSAGMTVHLKQSGELIKDAEDYPYVYQIVKVYQDRQRVSLVNTFGEIIGTFSIRDIVFFSDEPLFRPTDYEVGQVVNWIEYDDVYEGTITRLRESTAEVSNIKKLLSLDQKKNLPYYKIQSDDLYNKVLTSIVGDDIDSN